MTQILREPPPAEAAPHILVVDDDARIRTLLGRYLGREGFRVSMARDAADARAHLGALSFDLAVVDVMMPGESGLDLVAWLRSQQTSATPVLMLTARSEPADRIGGLEAGADDYLGKPFEPRELVLRIQSILRRATHRAEAHTPAGVRFGPFTFHLARGELRDAGEPVRLTERERDLLRALAHAGGETVSRAALAGPAGTNERTIDVQLARLRRKIEPDPLAPVHLLTVRGIGYRLVAAPMERA